MIHMKATIPGYPCIGAKRELKKATELYFKGQSSEEELQAVARALRSEHWLRQKRSGIDVSPCNDFSFYDRLLDMAVLLNAVPKRYRELGLSSLDAYFAMARGYQGGAGDVKALAMKKWFNTNYHYLEPELGDEALRLVGDKPFAEYEEAKSLGIEARPVLIGPFSFLKLSRGSIERKKAAEEELAVAYADLLKRFEELGACWVQLDEPSLVCDLTEEDVALFRRLYGRVLGGKGQVRVLLQTYFGDVRDVYREMASLPFDAYGLDFVEGKRNLSLLEQYGFPKDKLLVAGVVNGRNIWRNHYQKTLALVEEIRRHAPQVALSSSCSLLHVPYSVRHETLLPKDVLGHFAFAEEKLRELADLAMLSGIPQPERTVTWQDNARFFSCPRVEPCAAVREAVDSLSAKDFERRPSFGIREGIQRERLHLPLFPATTIGSFPQTPDVRANRAAFRKGKIDQEQYRRFNQDKIRECIRQQEEIGLDVLVHGEFERNDMVEYFGENLDGFLFTENAWVQSYGTRCVKPPVIWGDVAWKRPFTVEWSCFAQSCTKKPVKGMLTGPVTILNWSFPREDLSLRESALQIALAIRQEVLALEKAGIRIIQVDEAALKEKLPLRKDDWRKDYLDWAIPAFRLVHSGVRPETQIHTHMCYSELSVMIRDIDAMDADVITFEASRSHLGILKSLHECGFRTEVGPGVYDIHSPRIPTAEEISEALGKMVEYVEPRKLWVNPDCGLKTRGEEETLPSLRHMVEAAVALRRRYEAGAGKE